MCLEVLNCYKSKDFTEANLIVLGILPCFVLLMEDTSCSTSCLHHWTKKPLKMGCFFKGKKPVFSPVENFNEPHIERKKKMAELLPLKVYLFTLTLLHSERPKLHRVLVVVSAIGLS